MVITVYKRGKTTGGRNLVWFFLSGPSSLNRLIGIRMVNVFSHLISLAKYTLIKTGHLQLIGRRVLIAGHEWRWSTIRSAIKHACAFRLIVVLDFFFPRWADSDACWHIMSFSERVHCAKPRAWPGAGEMVGRGWWKQISHLYSAGQTAAAVSDTVE